MSGSLESLLNISGPAMILAILRFVGLVWVLPWSGQIPFRARLGIAISLGIALAGIQPASLVTWSILGAVSELLTGLSLGVSLRVVIAALTAAGSWVDEQGATGLTTDVWSDEGMETSSGTASILVWLGTWLILAGSPGLTVMERGLESLRVIPLGQVHAPSQLPEWTVQLLRSGSELAIGVALPAMLVAGLLQGGLALLGRGLGVAIAPAISPARAAISCGILVLILPWQAERIDHAAVDTTIAQSIGDQP